MSIRLLRRAWTADQAAAVIDPFASVGRDIPGHQRCAGGARQRRRVRSGRRRRQRIRNGWRSSRLVGPGSTSAGATAAAAAAGGQGQGGYAAATIILARIDSLILCTPDYYSIPDSDILG